MLSWGKLLGLGAVDVALFFLSDLGRAEPRALRDRE